MPSSVLKYEAHRFHDGYLQITIKDKGFLGQGIFLGEAFFPLNELRLGDMDQKLQDLQQIKLPLSKPSGFGKLFLFTRGPGASTNQAYSSGFFFKISWILMEIPFYVKIIPLHFCRASEASKIDWREKYVWKIWAKNLNFSLKHGYYGALILQELNFIPL